jgi:molecular chaperone DnaK (HSP70)
LVEFRRKKLVIEPPTKSDQRRLFETAEELKIQLTAAQTSFIVIEDILQKNSLTRDELNDTASDLMADKLGDSLNADEAVVPGAASHAVVIRSSFPSHLLQVIHRERSVLLCSPSNSVLHLHLQKPHSRPTPFLLNRR